MIRLIFVALFVVLFLIIGIPVLGIEWLIGKVSKKTMDYSVCIWDIRHLFFRLDFQTEYGQRKIVLG